MSRLDFTTLFSHSRGERRRQQSVNRLTVESLETRNLMAAITTDASTTDCIEPSEHCEIQPAQEVSLSHGNAQAHVGQTKTVILPTNSADGLADAIAQAGPGGTVIVESGLHTESASVFVDIPVKIIGQPGAVIESTTTPTHGNPQGDAALYVIGTRDVLIEGITLQSPSVSNIGIVIEDSPRVTVRNSRVSGHEVGIIIDGGDHSVISGNEIVGIDDGVGIVNSLGSHTRISDNDISHFFIGVFASDAKGQMKFNNVSENFIGMFFCKWDTVTASGWHVTNNSVTENAIFGVLVRDGANNSVFVNNALSDNGVDIQLDGELAFPDVVFPTSFENLVALGRHKDVNVVDGGTDNKVNG